MCKIVNANELTAIEVNERRSRSREDELTCMVQGPFEEEEPFPVPLFYSDIGIGLLVPFPYQAHEPEAHILPRDRLVQSSVAADDCKHTTCQESTDASQSSSRLDQLNDGVVLLQF